MIYPHPVTVHPSELTVDPDGNPVRRPSPVSVPARAYVQAVTSTEDPASNTAESRWVAYLDPAAPELDAHSRRVWAGRVFETVGEALLFTDPDGAIPHWRVTLRTVSA